VSVSRTELQDSVRKAFGDRLAPDAVTSWATIADMGLLMIAVPEAQGGLGLGNEALAALHYELGRALVPGPAIAQALVIDALAAAGEGSLLDAAMAGQKMTVAHFACDADVSSHVLFGGIDGITLVPAAAVAVTPRPTWDETRRLFTVETQDAGIAIAGRNAAQSLAGQLKARLCLMLAADALGGADAILALTIDYLKTRQQFDRPLAMFQALKHRVADMKTHLAAAEALLWSCAADPATTPVAMGALKAHATTVYRTIAEEALQLHGGIGLTTEHHCHRFLKRAFLNGALGGDADYHDEINGRAALKEVAR
jgi:alkylation response protein AidB-like acyl-CoA dehydrogenase